MPKMVTTLRKPYTQERNERLREIARERKRTEPLTVVRIDRQAAYDQMSPEKRLELTHEKKYRDFFTCLNMLVIWRNMHHETISIECQFKNLERIFGQKLTAKQSDLYLLITQYETNLKAVDNRYPFPERLIGSNYSFRYDAINELKKEAIKNLKYILEGN
jgi:hypothetical protein